MKNINIMKINNFKKTAFFFLSVFTNLCLNAQVSDFNKDTWGFEQTSGIDYGGSNTGNIVEAMTQDAGFTQSSIVSHTGNQSMLADFSGLSASPKLQSFRPQGTNASVGNFKTNSEGTHKASVWVYMDILQTGKLRFRVVGGGNSNNASFDFDLANVTKVNTWTKLTEEVNVVAKTGGSGAYAEVTFISIDDLLASNTKVYIDDFSLEKVTTETWTGGTSTDWFTTSNWDTGIVPTEGSSVIISSGGNQPEITTNRGAIAYNLTINSGASLTVENGSSLIVDGTSSGDITYNVNVADTNWHLISAPVVNEEFDNTWIANNQILASTTVGKTDNRAIGAYNNTVASDNWNYFDATPGTATTFDAGIGYSLKRISSGDYSFVGTYPTDNLAPTITQGSNNWNLVGNSFPSYLKIADFITTNTLVLSAENQAIYVWDGSTYQSLTTGYLTPGQAFFINSNVASGTLDITEGLLSHQTGTTFYKSQEVDKKIILTVSDAENNVSTEILYSEDKTIDLDPRFDIGLFDGVSSTLKIYTHLANNDSKIAFEKQALPISEIENLEISIGVKASEGKEITFSAEHFNLPSEVELFIEDKIANTFTSLKANNKYRTTLTSNIDGVGRFYLHTSQKALSVNDAILKNNIKIYKSSFLTLRMEGLPEGKSSITLYNILGKQVLNTSFSSIATKEITLPNLTKGIYLVKLQTEEGTLNRKIILE